MSLELNKKERIRHIPEKDTPLANNMFKVGGT
jgi:hypothetical protein